MFEVFKLCGVYGTSQRVNAERRIWSTYASGASGMHFCTVFTCFSCRTDVLTRKKRHLRPPKLCAAYGSSFFTSENARAQGSSRERLWSILGPGSSPWVPVGSFFACQNVWAVQKSRKNCVKSPKAKWCKMTRRKNCVKKYKCVKNPRLHETAHPFGHVKKGVWCTLRRVASLPYRFLRMFFFGPHVFPGK